MNPPRLATPAIAFLLFVCALFGAKQIHVEVTEMKLQRQGSLILVDATVKNVSGKPIKGLTMILKFYSPQHQVMSTQRIAVDEPELQADAESQVHAQLTAQPKAVTAEFSAVAAGEKHLDAANTGPFTIEE